MLCFRCGSYNVDNAAKCSVCGQTFAAKTDEPPAPKRPTSSTRIQAQIFAAGEVVGGRYKIIDELGRSGVGVVYRAYDQEIDADVALKAISPNLLQTTEERELFAREVKAARKLHHPNIVRIYEEGEKSDQRYFTMKLLEGLTLRKILALRHEKGQSFSSEEVIPIFHQIAAALDYAHKTTWHGDLKPENVIILPDLLKLTDFNIVRGLPLKPFLGLAKSRSNTYAYVAPELKVESQQIDGRCDIYSLGVILGEMLTGLVFEGHFTRAFTAALERLPPKVDGLIRRAVSEHPDGRFQKATELANTLEQVLEALDSPLPAPAALQGRNLVAEKAAAPPPPPEETQAGPLDHTDEDSGEDAGDSLEEIGASQIILLDPSSGGKRIDEWDRDTDMARKQPPTSTGSTQDARPGRDTSQDRTPQLAPSTGTSQEVAREQMKAEDLGEVLYSDDADLVPPPLPSDERLDHSESYDSLPPDGIAVAGSSDMPDFLGGPTVDESSGQHDDGPAMIGGDVSEEPTRTDGRGLGIHDALTALKDHPRPDLVSNPSGAPVAPSPPPPVLDADDAIDERPAMVPAVAPNVGRPTPPPAHAPLPPPVVSPPTPTAPTMRPVAPPKEKKRGRGLFWAAGLMIVFVIIGLVGWQVVTRLRDGALKIGVAAMDAGQATPIPIPPPTEVDAGAKQVAILSPEVASPAVAAPEVTTPEASTPEATPEPTPEASTVSVKKDAAAERARKKREEEKQRKAEEKKLEREKKREAEKLARDEMNEREREEKAARAEARREKEAAAKLKREEDRQRKADERKARAEEKKRKAEEEKQRKADEASKLAMAKKGNCLKGMRKIAAGRFKFGSSTSDPMRNFGEKIATTVNAPEFCMDYYEYPNSKSRVPTVGVTWSQAKSACARKKKRLCTEVEWERACKGPSGRRFAYGNTFRDGTCNTEDPEGSARPLGSGKNFAKCRSGFVIINLSGNAEEWTSSSFTPGSSSMTVKGGAGDRPDYASRCAARRGLSKRTTKKTLGFRCCADVQ